MSSDFAWTLFSLPRSASLSRPLALIVSISHSHPRAELTWGLFVVLRPAQPDVQSVFLSSCCLCLQFLEEVGSTIANKERSRRCVCAVGTIVVCCRLPLCDWDNFRSRTKVKVYMLFTAFHSSFLNYWHTDSQTADEILTLMKLLFCIFCCGSYSKVTTMVNTHTLISLRFADMTL